MKIHIFDVEHGECNGIETSTGEIVLIGLGHNSSTGWRPSSWIKDKGVRPHVVLTNLDRDHLSDIDNFNGDILPVSLTRNPYLTAPWVRELKIEESGEVHSSVEVALHWMENVFTGGAHASVWGLDERMFFYHSTTLFQKTNDLSVVTFIRYKGIGVMFTGDMEKTGWQELLKNPDFVDCLTKTNIFIASHHGRIGGYCAEMFEHCKPDIVIISDKEIVHGTQEHDSYSPHAKGIVFPNGTRKVLTTRSDGKITIEIDENGSGNVLLNQ